MTSLQKRYFILTLVVAVFLLFFAKMAYASDPYISESDLSGITSTEQFITTVALNLRSGPSTDYPRISLLQPGTTVTVTDFDPDGFSAVEVNGLSGFVASEFIHRHTPRNTSFEPGTVELLHWSEVQQILPLGTTIQVYDVRSGLTYYVRNFSNGRHADVEAITQQDTQIIFEANGHRWSWDPRPVLVTWPAIEGRTIAAAIHSMPHAGSTISGNGMNGHICIHFLGVVNSNPTWGAQMQAAVREAYNSR